MNPISFYLDLIPLQGKEKQIKFIKELKSRLQINELLELLDVHHIEEGDISDFCELELSDTTDHAFSSIEMTYKQFIKLLNLDYDIEMERRAMLIESLIQSVTTQESQFYLDLISNQYPSVLLAADEEISL